MHHQSFVKLFNHVHEATSFYFYCFLDLELGYFGGREGEEYRNVTWHVLLSLHQKYMDIWTMI